MTGSGLCVVGTDTGVGKTVVTAGLTAWLRAAGYDAKAVKPAQTGYPPDDDAGFVAAACDDERAAVALERLEPPLAPRVAAAEVGQSLDYDSILARCRSEIADSEVGLVEGIGGLRVPLAGDREVVDLVADLDLPTLVVARSGLGTLNHTALTVEALARWDVDVHAVILNQYAGSTVAARTNPDELERMTGVSVATLPPVDASTPERAALGVRERLPLTVFPFDAARLRE
ncbi:dethiobiotin synthetase [Halogranum amylolyticum]|uniref:ATP-dependent dethiobiotin synthetase BioD n=1 Tax=Halogranum amylolyticum TaxID=660520 RepID=A0A1H8RJV0_9EURY|nr:dethiobiotin synthase [Halogranum amylolyticum]SEO66819.1 dethiobiotin synthetase [Halogranum amylolyticum]